ncbi:MAG TPA: hypothetical protein VHS55_01655, partial [Solirubrobacteraceae bacterium]|nr:hypothetical protein [Solirubrobacteraceae bacterium]
RTNAGDVDILLGIPCDGRWDLARYDQLCEQAVVIEIGGAKVLAASLEDIMRSKEIANRPPDQEALPELRELKERQSSGNDLDGERYR